ncbi:MAG: hypothetical protein JXA74_13965 [Anaerolineae bacterium]|nr:hypothetical protein [Anaerolineae bacterium]
MATPYLLPAEAPGFVVLNTVVVQGDLVCEQEPCRLRVRQSYQLHNRDQTRSSTLRLGLPRTVAEVSTTVEVAAQGEGSWAVQPGDEHFETIWELSLGRNERRTITLVYEQENPSTYFFAWAWDGAALGAWGRMESARVEIAFPTRLVDEMLLGVSPADFVIEGVRLYWEYEDIATLPRHELIVYAPPSYERMHTLRSLGGHRELAQLYQSLDVAAAREGIPLADHYSEILAALQAALAENPQDMQTRLDLVALYRARGDTLPELKLNYLLLSAQQLAVLLAQEPARAGLAQTLAQTYYDAAQLANQQGDPASALLYLKQAAEVADGQGEEVTVAVRELTMQWALDLARQGQVLEALAQLEGTLSEATEESLLHYAPDLRSARTDVYLEQRLRRVHYQLLLYPPRAAQAEQAVRALAERVEGLSGWATQIESGPDRPDELGLEIAVAFDSISQLRARAEELDQALKGEEDLLAALILAPWRGHVEHYAVAENPWYILLSYREQIDLSALDELLAERSEYARWRLVELRALEPEGATARFERELGLIALREYQQTWEQFASGTYWVYHVSHARVPQMPAATWLISWGQSRLLELSYPSYDWRVIGGSLLAVSAFLGLLIGLTATRRRQLQFQRP